MFAIVTISPTQWGVRTTFMGQPDVIVFRGDVLDCLAYAQATV